MENIKWGSPYFCWRGLGSLPRNVSEGLWKVHSSARKSFIAMRMVPLLMPTFAFCCIVCFIKQSVQTRQSIIIVMRMAFYNLPTFSLSCVVCFIQWSFNWQGNMTDVLSFLKQNHFFWVASTIYITTRQRFVLFSGRSIQKTLHIHFHWLPFANYMKISWSLYI